MKIQVIAEKMSDKHKQELEEYLWQLLQQEVFKFDVGLDDLKDAPIAIRRVVGKLRRDRKRKRG